MQKYQQTQPPLKTYLVNLGIATTGLDSSRDNFELKLIEASELAAATECVPNVIQPSHKLKIHRATMELCGSHLRSHKR